MRSRLAILTMLVLGFAFSGAGVGLAVTGVGSQGTSAADQQYAPPTPNPTTGPTLSPNPPANEVEGETDEGTNPGVAGDSDDQGGNEVAAVEESRQLAVEQGGQELPFTGFAAIPVLLMGLALLTGGFLLRRRSTGSDSL